MSRQDDLFDPPTTDRPGGAWPDGLRYRDGFIDADEEARLLAAIAALPLEPACYQGHVAGRRVASLGLDDVAEVGGVALGMASAAGPAHALTPVIGERGVDDADHAEAIDATDATVPTTDAGTGPDGRHVAARPDAAGVQRSPALPWPPAVRALRERIAGWLGLEPAALAQGLVTEYRPGTPLGWHRDMPRYGLVAGVSLAGDARMRLRPHPPFPASRGPGAASLPAPRSRRPLVLDLPLPPRSAYAFADEARWDWQHSIVATETLRYSITFRTLAAPGEARSPRRPRWVR